MEAAEETLTYRDDTGLHKKLLPEDKDYCEKEIKERVDARSEESNYMDTKTDSAKTVKVSFTGEGNQLSVSKCDGFKQESNEKSSLEELEDTILNQPVFIHDSADVDLDQLGKDGHSECSEVAQSDSDDLQYTDMYLNSKTEDEDEETEEASALLSDHYGLDSVEDESHYITTHEIQLTELDHDVDYDLGRGTRWEFEDDNLVYSFVDYATLETDNTNQGTLILEKVQANLGGRVVSTEQDESDLCESEKFANSDESVCKNLRHSGETHLAIETASRAMDDPLPVLGRGDRGRVSRGSSGARAQYFIPAPGRQHLATKLRRKDINEYSSGASSSISELDDADKEVRNLTAKSFRSLACPYFDAINLSTSSESSISEYGLNKWAFVDWNYRNISRSKEHSIIAHKNTTLERNQSAEKQVAQTKHTPGFIPTMENKETSSNPSSSSKQIELRSPVLSKQREMALNFHCNVDTGEREGTRHPKSASAGSREVHGAVLAKSRCEMEYRHTDDGDPHKKAIFASSLLKNVISKKMQFEKERKMERGEIHDTRLGLSPCFPDVLKVRDLGRSLQRQTSESGSGFTVNSTEVEGSRASSSGPTDEGKNKKDHESNKRQLDSPPKVSHTHHAPDTVKETENNTNSMLTKLLFVPRCQLYTKDRDFSKDRSSQASEATNSTGKSPEIKICLRSVKENKGCTLNIASLLTPKISYSAVNTLRATGEMKCPIVSASDKMPSFTVRDIRDTKCKFQTPIYQVRDVRKLVKSSYRFVSLDNSENKNPAAVSTAANTVEMNKDTVKQPLTVPIVIKCHSVKTNMEKNIVEASQRGTEAGRPFPKVQSHTASSELNPEHEGQSDNKLVKQRLEKISGEFPDCKGEPKIPKQAAIEKLKAAVKSMEQLYVFDRNEWKRKNQALHSNPGGHVRSLISKEEQRVGGTADSERAHSTQTYKPHTKGYMNVMHVPFNSDTITQLQPNKEGSRRSLHPERTEKSHLSKSPVNNAIPQSPSNSSTMKSSKAAAPLSVKIDAPKCGQLDTAKVTANPTVAQAISDSENYLTIPGLTPDVKALSGKPEMKKDSVNKHETYITTSNQKSSPLIMEYPSSTLYHHSAVVPQHVLCFSNSIPTMSPTPSGGDMQRKMLLDPTTGHYYLVDTAVQATKRLYDPDTGQFVDLPMSHSPVSPVTPVASVTPVPLSLSPLACAPTYMIYPGFIPSPTLTMQPVHPQSHCHPEEAAREKLKSGQHKRTSSPIMAEKVYYSASGEATQSEQLPESVGHVTTQGRAADRKPLISITTPQGPRIIAPPSFDGTTMSFVVEHR
ncbi:uncharacterized protein C4orf54-like [Eucyclogobius newberryi]|uniref:uncharacterized protein C4orf54-like n=1 Tax=Eucyclogobius newberryi TaxID=166745 RepID=UPI003B5CFC87